MSKKIVIRNVPTHELLLLLAQANALRAPVVDVSFDFGMKTLGITPIAPTEVHKRFMEGKDQTDMEDIINEEPI